jgi:signal peptidase I
MWKNLKNMLKIISISLSLLLLSCSEGENNPAQQEVGCVDKIVVHNIKGTSLTGLLENGDKVIVLHGFYNCHQVERGDLIVFSNPAILGGANVIKIAVGIAGDKLEMVDENGKTYIFINGKVARNPMGEKYHLSSAGKSYIGLALGGKDSGIIPRGHYLVLGTGTRDGKSTIGGATVDSRRFGFLAHRDLIGKAEVL